jgi:hypothetical protein
VCIALSQIPVALAATPDWEPKVGDIMVVNVKTNVGYIIQKDGNFLSYPVGTGVQKNVYYLGNYYYAGTPLRTWSAEEVKTQSDRVTFGADGTFIRLFWNGKATKYGIHTHRDVDKWFKDDNRYRSMGCIILDGNKNEGMMKIILDTFHANNDKMTVITTDSNEEIFRQIFARQENQITQ